MARVYKRGDRWYVSFKNADNKRQIKRVAAKTQAEAKRQALALELEAERVARYLATREDVRKVYDMLVEHGDDESLGMAFVHFMGLRPAEVLALKFGDVEPAQAAFVAVPRNQATP